MNTDIDDITEKIIGCAFRVSNTLGSGFLEKVYENSLCIELRIAGLCFEQQEAIRVLYENEIVGEYFADLVVEKKVIVELKASREMNPVYQAQMLNYLKATKLKVGLLINFGTPRLGIKRMVL